MKPFSPNKVGIKGVSNRGRTVKVGYRPKSYKPPKAR